MKTKTESTEQKFQIEVGSGRSWVDVTEWIFRSWTGKRRLNGKPYSGDTFYLGTDRVFHGGGCNE